MVWIYTQGSKNLGLGHLSRVVPIYHELISAGYEVNIFLTGDELGESYLESYGVKNDSKNEISNSLAFDCESIWIIDATKIFQEKMIQIIANSKTCILLSPKFEISQSWIIDYAFIRSDPFHLPISNKFVKPTFFTFNKLKKEKTGIVNIGIALSGSDASPVLNELLRKLVNSDVASLIDKLYVFLGASLDVSIIRNTTAAYKISIILISTLDSLWNHTQNIDILIAGNGLIVDECIEQGMEFLVYAWHPSNQVPKTGNTEIIKTRMCFTSDELLANLSKLIKSKAPSVKQKEQIKVSKSDLVSEIIKCIEDNITDKKLSS